MAPVRGEIRFARQLCICAQTLPPPPPLILISRALLKKRSIKLDMFSLAHAIFAIVFGTVILGAQPFPGISSHLFDLMISACLVIFHHAPLSLRDAAVVAMVRPTLCWPLFLSDL